ncbi:tetraprenyl-beta-curcumene synthase family protein [Virgibacillus siamensis]|uniref:tetraprenyl-beta-curcumene synthase family protein n=1 Tax=Virgibacillus siamensis TaxID=480071 RepID=UPI001FEC1DB3|nr:tetraprenyl-beta-curcumene synthase family protein [Virgibacillus siamensis]
MEVKLPKSSLTLMANVYLRIFPAVKKELEYWKKRAAAIPDAELRTQALASIRSKRFHCQGGAVYALLAGDRWNEAVRFIVAYQTISDYLDNLCDRSTSLDPADFRLLHQSMVDALSPGNTIENYYRLRQEQSDGSYLADLVHVCQRTIRILDNYDDVRDYLFHLNHLYCDLQVHKHVRVDERVSRLQNWYEKNSGKQTRLAWYEFSAAAGSTLGIFCIVSYSLGRKIADEEAAKICRGYFPYMQGLHILLDYYIDQLEDQKEADLNFCSFFDNEAHMKRRFMHFIEQASWQAQQLPDRHFHEMIQQGLIGLYLGDPKVQKLIGGEGMTKQLIQTSGGSTWFFHWNTRMYYTLKRKRASRN